MNLLKNLCFPALRPREIGSTDGYRRRTWQDQDGGRTSRWRRRVYYGGVWLAVRVAKIRYADVAIMSSAIEADHVGSL